MNLGLIGTINNSGLGAMAKQLHRMLDVGIHLVVPHPTKGTHLADVRGAFLEGSPDSGSKDIEGFLARKPDIVLFLEYPYNWDYVRRIHREGIPIVWIPMLDSCGVPWIRKEKCLDCIDMFLAPSRHAHTILESHGLPSLYFPWGIDTDYFAFKQRGLGAEITFVHNVGYGGDRNRKGWDLVLKAWKQVKRFGGKLVVHSQIPIARRLLKDVDFRLGDFREARDLYDVGDVYLAPSRREGLGLPFREALSSGMPVIATDIPPINEVVTDREFLVRARPGRQIGRLQDGCMYKPDLNDLVDRMKWALQCGTIPEKSRAARSVIMPSYSWKKRAPAFVDILERISSTCRSCARADAIT